MPDAPVVSEREHLEASTRRWMVAGLVLMGLLVLAFPFYRLYEPARRDDARSNQAAFLAEEGAQLFATSCASCHGANGSGAIAPAIGSLDFLESVDEVQIFQLISLGIPGSEMVAYSSDFGGPMTSQDIDAVTTYLRSLEANAVAMPNWRTPLSTEDLSAQELTLLICSRCHGNDLTGIDGLGPDLTPTSLALMESDEWITARITEGYQLMPRFGTTLTQDQIASIVAYLRFGDNPPPPTTTTTVAPGTDTTTTTVAAGPAPDPSNDDVLALGERLFQREAGPGGCQLCHGPDANGTPNGPNITGTSRSGITRAMAEVPDMDFSQKLTSEEVEAVYAYLQWLVAQN